MISCETRACTTLGECGGHFGAPAEENKGRVTTTNTSDLPNRREPLT
jgi:hypothetical protein